MRILIIENGLSSSYIAFRYSVWYRSQKNEAYSSTQAELMQTMIVALGLGGIVDSIESNRKQKKEDKNGTKEHVRSKSNAGC